MFIRKLNKIYLLVNIQINADKKVKMTSNYQSPTVTYSPELQCDFCQPKN